MHRVLCSLAKFVYSAVTCLRGHVCQNVPCYVWCCAMYMVLELLLLLWLMWCTCL